MMPAAWLAGRSVAGVWAAAGCASGLSKNAGRASTAASRRKERGSIGMEKRGKDKCTRQFQRQKKEPAGGGRGHTYTTLASTFFV
ncbi:hypothetical protein GCM10027422_12840 [Hymenobacter arcticus]